MKIIKALMIVFAVFLLNSQTISAESKSLRMFQDVNNFNYQKFDDSDFWEERRRSVEDFNRRAEELGREWKRQQEAKRRAQIEAQKREEDRKRQEEENKRRAEQEKIDRFNALIAEGDKYYNAKDYLNAATSYAEAKVINSSKIDHYCSELIKNGDNLTNQQNYSAATDYYKKALIMNLNNNDAYTKLWDNYSNKTENYNDAIAFYQQMVAIIPKDNYSYFRLGWLYDATRAYDSAIKSYKTAIDLSPKDKFIHRNLAYTYFKKDDYDNALKYFESALKIDSKDAEIKSCIAATSGIKLLVEADNLNENEASKKYKEALKKFDQAIKLNNESDSFLYFQIYLSRGICNEQLKNYEAALKDYEVYLQEYPNDQDIIAEKQNIEAIINKK